MADRQKSTATGFAARPGRQRRQRRHCLTPAEDGRRRSLALSGVRILARRPGPPQHGRRRRLCRARPPPFLLPATGNGGMEGSEPAPGPVEGVAPRPPRWRERTAPRLGASIGASRPVADLRWRHEVGMRHGGGGGAGCNRRAGQPVENAAGRRAAVPAQPRE